MPEAIAAAARHYIELGSYEDPESGRGHHSQQGLMKSSRIMLKLLILR